MAIEKAARANVVSAFTLAAFLLSFSFCKPTEKPTGMTVYSLFRGMIKRIAFVGVGKARGFIVLEIGKWTGGRF